MQSKEEERKKVVKRNETEQFSPLDSSFASFSHTENERDIVIKCESDPKDIDMHFISSRMLSPSHFPCKVVNNRVENIFRIL